MAAAPPHFRAAPLARALRARASATSTVAAPTSRRALLGLSELELRQLALDLGQVPLLHHLPCPALPRLPLALLIFSSTCAAKLPREAAARPPLQVQGQANPRIQLR